MNTFVTLELQTGADGRLTVVQPINTYDDPTKTEEQNLMEALSYWHQVEAYATISSLPVHAAVVLNNEGDIVEGKAYHHGGQPE